MLILTEVSLSVVFEAIVSIVGQSNLVPDVLDLLIPFFCKVWTSSGVIHDSNRIRIKKRDEAEWQRRCLPKSMNADWSGWPLTCEMDGAKALPG